MKTEVINHYDLLIDEGNDPFLDPPELKEYMNNWDGQAFINLLDLNHEKRALEIGCGTGRLAVQVAPKVKSFLGIDISPKTVSVAKQHLNFSNVQILCEDFYNFKSEARFDLIYSSLTFMHFGDKQGAINKAYELLTKGGIFVLSIDKNQSEFIDYGTRKIKVYPDNPQTITALLKNSGFGKVQVQEAPLAHLILAIK